MTAQQLRNSILQQAIQGRLVPQDPNDEPASVLLERIRKEKEQLVKEGKLKKKDLVVTPIADDEKPFDIPSGWEWCRTKSIFNVCSARRVHEKDWRDKGIPFYRAREIGKLADLGHVSNDLFIDKELYDEFSKSGVPHGGDLMVTAVGTLGKVYVVKENEVFYYKDGSVLCFENIGHVDASYLKYVIESPFYKAQYEPESGGTTVATLTMVRVNEYLIPLPPLAEQRRIVAKIEELMPLVEKYGKAQSELNNLNQDLPRRLRQSVLQQAIQGKLVDQDEKEGNSAEFCRAQNIETLESDELEVPQSWSICTLGQLVETISGTSYGKGDVRKEGLRILRGGNIQDNKLVLASDDVFIPLSFKTENKNIQKGDIIIVGSTGSKKVIGKPALITTDYPDTQIGAFLRIIRPKYPELIPYIWTIFQSPLYRERISTLAKGTNINNIKEEYITELPIPLPPLAEQRRIVAKIEELFAEIDKLK